MKLSFRLAAAFVAFVVLGSLALVLWLGFEERRQLREQFAAMARTNAEFIRAQNLPPTERTARSLGEVLGLDVIFANDDRGEDLVDPRNETGTSLRHGLAKYTIGDTGRVNFSGDIEAVAQPIGEHRHLVLIRPRTQGFFTVNLRTLAILAAFWALSLALASALARGIVRPLRALAARLPHISEETKDHIPETTRADEIGQLARAYAETRAQLSAERQAREQAERLAALGKMATGLAHEINNPVAAIKLHAQLMESDTGVSPVPTVATTGDPQTSNDPSPSHAGHRRDARATFAERLGIILAESAKIESLVSQWMFLARPQPPQTSPCDFTEILTATVRALAPAAQHANVQIFNEVPPGCIAAADRRRLSQAITNVITNAIHAMSARGGVLTVRSRARESAGAVAKDSTPRSHEHGYDITFTDTGPGFSATALASATDLFFTEKEGGMGIGLNVAAGILKAHGGELRIANAPGGGAVVKFILPAAS